jgi:hypothetical protein
MQFDSGRPLLVEEQKSAVATATAVPDPKLTFSASKKHEIELMSPQGVNGRFNQGDARGAC